MNLSWIKIGSRIAVLVIVYLLLSIPNTKYQYFSTGAVQDVPFSFITDKLVTNHISSVLTYSEEVKSRQYDSLVNLLNNRLTALKSEILDIKSPIIATMTQDIGLASALVGLSSNNPQPILENLWQWRQYLKEQSLFWNISDSDQKFQIASVIRFVGICEDFIVVNRGLVYTKLTNEPTSLEPATILSNMVSGDFLLSTNDISYSYPEQAKFIHGLTPSLGLILIKGDSSFYISTSPSDGLHTIKLNDFISRPFARRLILRLRGNLPELKVNPEIPHQAANIIYELAADHNIDYDFTVNQQKRMSLCEISLIKFAYEGQITSFITSFSPFNNEFIYGLKRLGIKNESLVIVSELQYHPSIEIIGQQLFGEGIKIRNLEMASTSAGLATIDAKLMKSLRWRLPYYRLLKGYSHISSLIGNTAIIPSGMAPEAAIIHDYIRTQNKELLPLLVSSVAQFEKENKYYPTYTILCEMATINLSTLVNM
jgi:hypothetical protein